MIPFPAQLTRRLSVLLAALLLSCSAALAQEPVDLIPESDALEVWSFNNGQEFPGATGKLKLDEDTPRNGKASLQLIGDFTGGGGYVQAGRRLDDIDVQTLSLWVKADQVEQFTLRLGDSSGQTHQIRLKVQPGPGWKQVVLPLKEFFERRGQSDAVTTITDYQSWGGAKDGNWHGPARGLYLLLSNRGENTVRKLWLSDVRIQPTPQPLEGVASRSEVPLLEVVDGIHEWRFSNGPEFKGATGALTPEDDHLKLNVNFTEGGAYVAAIRDLDALSEAQEVSAIRMQLKSENARSLSIQLVDATGQTHQRKALPVQADGNWHDFKLIPADIAGGEHWGGANDGEWHDPPQKLVMSLTTRSADTGKPELLISDVHAVAAFPVFAQPEAFTIREPVVLSRTLEEVNEPRIWTSPKFDAAPGQWQIGYAAGSDLESPDNSYSGVLELAALDSAGQKLESFTIADVFGKTETPATDEIVTLPTGTTMARFEARLNKTHGEFRIDQLSAAWLAPAPRTDDRIERILFSTAQVGNLLFPEDTREVEVTVQARKPLPDSLKTISWVIRDYWGAEHTVPSKVMLADHQKEEDRLIYQATIDLSEAALEEGRYYELHAEIAPPADGGLRIEPFRNHTSLAILPEAVTHQYEPMEVPFTARNWDNRIPEYIDLTHRLGVRVCGLWGGWSSEPPYTPSVPRLEQTRKLGMGWLTTTPIKFIERNRDENWSEEALSQGAQNFVRTFGDQGPLIINLGNEPHGTGERVQKNVEAYRIVYQAIKEVAPDIPVVATSVEPNEEYFSNGYGQWCDAYDFHIYEHHTKVRHVMEEYQALMEKYDVVKPLWSTELGLNSQGQPRLDVSRELIKKFATFFAAGGENVSWFGLLYPDPDGKSHGSSGDSHNVFDCRYKRYAPRLDAVTYYHAVNAIAIKRFVEEKTWPNGVQGYLFRDRNGQCLQVLWTEEEDRTDIFLPMPGVDAVALTHLDGSQSSLNAAGEGLTLGISSDPLMLVYQDEAGGLAAELGEPAVKMEDLPDTINLQDTLDLSFSSELDGISLGAPPFWEVESTASGFLLTPPEDTSVREVELTLLLPDGRGESRFRLPTTE